MKTPVSIGWTVIRKNAVSTLFERTDGKERIAAVFNFSDEDQKGYELPVEDAKRTGSDSG